MIIMAKIAIDARQLRGTGVGRYLERLIHYLQKIDNENDYTILLKPEDMSIWQPSNPHFVKLACPHKDFTIDEQIGFKKQLEELKPDLVHFGMVQQPIFYHGRVVTTMHDLTTVRFKNPDKNPLVFAIKQNVYVQVNKRVAKKSEEIIVPSQFVKDDIVKFTGVDPNKFTVTYEAADPITAQPEALTSLVDKDFIMYVGRPTPHKNLERLIDAFIELKNQYPNLHLVLAGKKDANYERIAANVANRKIDKVVFMGFVTEGQLRWLYEHCKAYIFPSLSEGFGLPGLEAMIHGAPVVSSNATCLPEIYGNAAHYFNPIDTKDMATKISEVISNEVLTKQLVNTGHLQVARYSWQAMAEQTYEIYSKVLGQTRS